MASLNQCNFIGNVGRDPEIRYSQDGKAVASLSIAVTEKWKDNERTEWVRVVAFGKLAEIIGQYVKKGSPLFISGRLQTRTWDNKEGVKQYTTEIVADKMQMLGGKGQTDQEQGQNQGQGQDNAPDDDDIPF